MKEASLRTFRKVAVLVALHAIPACATEVPPQIFSINGATVGITTLDEIQKTYGRAELLRTGRGEEADVLICYVHSSPKGKSFLVFESGAMGGWRRITGFRISTTLPSRKCVPTKIDIVGLAAGNTIELGQSQARFLKAVPIKFERIGSELTYEAMSRREATQEELNRMRSGRADEKQLYFDVMTVIKARFHNNCLVDLYIHRIETY